MRERRGKSSAADLDDHLDGGQGGGDVLRVGRPHRDGDTACVQAAVEGCDQVDPCRRRAEHQLTLKRASKPTRE